MCTRLWLLAGIVLLLLLMGTPVFADDLPGASDNAPVEPSDAMRAWLGQDTGDPLTCADVTFMAAAILPQAAIDELNSVSEADCVEPVEDMNRIQAWTLLSSVQYEPGNDATGSRSIEIPLTPGTTRNSGTETAPHTHDYESTHDHHHHGGTQGGAVGQHDSWPEYYTFRWRHGGEEQDHIKTSVEIDHHWSHFHYARDFYPTLHMVDDDHHQYRQFSADGALGGKNDSNNYDLAYEYYTITVRYEYRYCAISWWCFKSWDKHQHSSTCRAKSHNEWYSENCYIDE